MMHLLRGLMFVGAIAVLGLAAYDIIEGKTTEAYLGLILGNVMLGNIGKDWD